MLRASIMDHEIPDNTEKWEPLNFQCPHHCYYCPSKNLSKTPKLTSTWFQIPDTFKPAIWVCARTDLFADAVPGEFIETILRRTREVAKCYIFSTKNPGRYFDYLDQLPAWAMLNTSIESDIDYRRSLAPPQSTRIRLVKELKLASDSDYEVTLSLQPIMKFTSHFYHLIRDAMPDQVCIGKELTNIKAFPMPAFEDVLGLARRLSRHTTVNIHGRKISWNTLLDDWPPKKYNPLQDAIPLE